MKNEYQVSDLVPHTGTMSLLSEILDYGDDWLRAKVDISHDSIFVEEKGVPAVVGLEYLAQTVAAYAGLQQKSKGARPKLGFLLGARKYVSSTEYFPIGETLIIYIQLEMQAASGLGAFNCELKGGKCEATARLNVFQPDNTEKFLQEKGK